LKHIKDETGTTVDTVALELMAQSYMGTGVVEVISLKAALNAEFKKSENEEAFLETVTKVVQEIIGHEIISPYQRRPSNKSYGLRASSWWLALTATLFECLNYVPTCVSTALKLSLKHGLGHFFRSKNAEKESP